jgi:hypothetical protein
MADAVAAALGIPKDSPFRVTAALFHTLQRLADDGHVYVPAAVLQAITALRASRSRSSSARIPARSWKARPEANPRPRRPRSREFSMGSRSGREQQSHPTYPSSAADQLPERFADTLPLTIIRRIGWQAGMDDARKAIAPIHALASPHAAAGSRYVIVSDTHRRPQAYAAPAPRAMTAAATAKMPR